MSSYILHFRDNSASYWLNKMLSHNLMLVPSYSLIEREKLKCHYYEIRFHNEFVEYC